MYQRIGTDAFKKDLTNILALCDRLDNPQNDFPSVHIAGTNGKGSVSHLLTSCLMESGLKVGTYTSPHYVSFRERIKVNGQPISKDFVTEFVEQIESSIKEIKPSFFEITVAMAFQYFAENEVDITVVETGLGGRLDSTNVLRPRLSIITNIGMDHQAMLGDTLEKIAFEKAGIIKPNTPVIIGKKQSETEAVFQKRAEEEKAPLQYVNSDSKNNVQEENIATVKAAFGLLRDEFSLDDDVLQAGIDRVVQNTSYYGRYQQISKEPSIWLDSAHNVDGLSRLLQFISRQSYEQLHVVLGTVNDKQLEPIFDLLPSQARYYAVEADIPRKMPSSSLCELMKAKGFQTIDCGSTVNGYQNAKSSLEKNDLLLVAGSIFIIGEVLAFEGILEAD